MPEARSLDAMMDRFFSELMSGDPIRKTIKFIAAIFAGGLLLGAGVALGFYWYLKAIGKWDPSAHLFPAIVIVFGLGFTVPALTVSLRVMFLSLAMGFKGVQDMQKFMNKVDLFQQKADPILNQTNQVLGQIGPMTKDVGVVLGKASQMSEDVVSIAHKTRTVLEHINGTFDVKVISEKLDTLTGTFNKVSSNLEAIASVFTGGLKASQDESLVPEFDPLKLSSRRRRS